MNKPTKINFWNTVIFNLVLIGVTSPSQAEDCVVMLHGLASSPVIFKPLELVLDLQPELRVHNQGYNSYEAPISELSNSVLRNAVEGCNIQESEQIHFVTHSMGGILLRAYLAENNINHLGRVVMIAPPNQGSGIVDLLDKYKMSGVLGPAGKQLSTDIDNILNNLPEVDMELGIIAGTREKQWILGRFLPEGDDGKVSVENTKLQTMDDFIQVEAGHTALLMKKKTIEQTIQFLRYGYFQDGELEPIMKTQSSNDQLDNNQE